MKTFGTLRQRVALIASMAAIFLAVALAQAQTHPHLFRQAPTSTPPGRNATIAFIGDIRFGSSVSSARWFDHSPSR
jgi:hypothetical protein